ncbi:YmfQ family protein [Acinetobacter venetianus]|uniref:YmfQ family protein n=1 Tax=Acinetobacter venetianus TaxID=52133 RepID=UPI00214FBB0F|nr:YmfQ family protein [Acinetobacter venetianus]MCR4530223.1 YmfQ family protein [Acinetobacter venetianus]
MAESKFTLAQYTGALKNLLPRGRVWSRENTGIQHELIEGLAKSFQQMDKDAVQLLIEAFPSTTTDLIDEWNETVGIPDTCFGAPESIEQNRQYIVAKLIADGGQTVNYYKSIAASLGLNIKIREFSGSTPGTGAPSGFITHFDHWAHTWQVRLDVNSPSILEFSGNLEAITQSQVYQALSCLLARYKPAHTQFYISVVDPNEPPETVFGFDLDNTFISGFDTSTWSNI